MVKKNQNMGESPLLSNDRTSSPRFQSTVKSEEFEPRRLTERQLMEEDGNSVRILIYVIIVIIVGVGTALLIRSLISKNESTQESEDTPIVEEDTQENPALKINKVVQPDSSAANVGKNEDYVDSAILTLGDASLDATTITLNSIELTPFTSFVRLRFDMSGSASNVPKTTFNFDSIKKQLSIELASGTNIVQDLKSDNTVGGLISEIRFDTVNNKFIVVLSEDAKYRVFQSAGDLFVDFKTVEELQKPEGTTSGEVIQDEESTGDSGTTGDETTRPTGTNYENDFSQNQQYITSNVTGNSVSQNKYYFYDAGAHFEFSWGHTGAKGDAYIPNVTAYLKDESGKSYIYVEIENLSQEIFLSNGITGTNLSGKIDTSGANFVRVDLVKFEGGKATYKVELKRKADFSLVAEPAFGEVGQLITLKMKD